MLWYRRNDGSYSLKIHFFILFIYHILLFNCHFSTSFSKFSSDPLDPDLSAILTQKQSQIYMPDLPYMKEVRIVSFDSEFSEEEMHIIAESFDLIRLMIHLKEFDQAVNDVKPIKHLENDFDSDGWCTYSPKLTPCSQIPPGREAMSLTEFFTIIQSTPKRITIRKATGKRAEWRAFASVAGDDIAWNQHKESKEINKINQPNVAKTMFHELLHSFGYHHGTRAPYKVGELILYLHRKYRHTPILNGTIQGGFVDRLKTHPPEIKFYFE